MVLIGYRLQTNMELAEREDRYSFKSGVYLVPCLLFGGQWPGLDDCGFESCKASWGASGCNLDPA